MVTAPHSADLLAAWEEAEGRSPVDRGLALLALTDPGADRERLATLSVAERDERVLALRTRLWGARLDAFAECPACGERLELAIDAGALGQAPADASWAVAGVRFRLPDIADLAAAAACSDPEEGRLVLAARCIDGEPNADVIGAVAARMAEVAGPTDVAVAIACPACGHAWEEDLDVPAFVWHELAAAARRLLVEIDALARVYGWSEEAVLGLSPRRRHRYVELAAG
jgi:hypothetical protein